MNRSWPWALQLDMESQCRPARSTALWAMLITRSPRCRARICGNRRSACTRSLASSGQPDRTRSPHMASFGRAGSKPPCRSAAATFRAGRRGASRAMRKCFANRDHRPDEMPALPQLLECAIKESWLSHSASPVNAESIFYSL